MKFPTRMKVQKWSASFVLVAGLVTVAVAQDAATRKRLGMNVGQTEGDIRPAEELGNPYSDETGPYDVVPNWPQPLHADWTGGATPTVWAESPNRVFVMQREELPVLKIRFGPGGVPARAAEGAPGGRTDEHKIRIFDANGKLVEAWPQWNDVAVRVHRMAVDPNDPERHIWIVDNGMHQAFKITNDGKKLVMTLGVKGVRGNDKTHFSGPTGQAFLPNGDFFITDSDNARVVKFSKDGKCLLEFGGEGKAPGQFSKGLHSIAVDAKQRVYVTDRNGHRIEVFDANGKFIKVLARLRWPDFVGISKDQYLWVTDGEATKILKYDLEGRLLYSWGTFGANPGQFFSPHHLSTDSEGNLYVAETYGGRAQKFRPKKGADPSKLVGQLFWR